MQALETLFKNSLVLDTETTSIHFQEAEVIQYAHAEYTAATAKESAAFTITRNEYFKPHTPIDPEVSSINFISNRMVAKCFNFDDTLHTIQADFDTHEFMVAHNAFYDMKVLQRYGLKLPKIICTMRMAKKLYGEDDSIKLFNLSYLRYALDLPVSDDLPAHKADSDVIVTSVLYQTLVLDAIAGGHIDPNSSVSLGDQIIAWLDAPITVRKMPFGKHKGKDLIDIPLDYWKWAFENLNSLNEEHDEYDKDFAASAANAVEKLLEG